MNAISNEDLLEQIYLRQRWEQAFQQLIDNLRPMMVKIGKQHLYKIPIYDTDDYIQEGSIVLWQLIQSKKYNGNGKFSSLFYTVFDRKCNNLYRDYVLKNFIEISESEDLYCYGYHVATLVEDEYARTYREKHREQCRRWCEKNRKKPAVEPKPKLTPEERKERNRQRSREYYRTHKEQCLAAKHKWYRENHEYALLYQRAYDQGVRIGEKGRPKKVRG